MYEILSVQDVSRPCCKRFVAHINTDIADKNGLKSLISDVTERLKFTDDYSSEVTKQKFKTHAHVVRLYIHINSRLKCQSMWVDKTLVDVPLPKPLEYNDFVNDIGIMWLD